jgi:16S rRNA (cytidine1402-2'-O)-methyltransferase
MGKLYVCPTPIGNLDDITYRVVKALDAVDIVAAEDTRHTLKLLNHLGLHKKMISYHDHNRKHAGKAIIDHLESGRSVALVSDAGMPGISDPGEDIIREMIDLGYEFEVLPGPSALINGLVGSGMPTKGFTFLGFLPKEKKDIKALLKEYEESRFPLIMYEAPHRLHRTLVAIESSYGNREIVVCRELTKRYEEYFRTTLAEAIEKYGEAQPKGEIVLLVGPGAKVEAEKAEIDMACISEMVSGSKSSKDAVKSVMERYGISRNESYELVIRARQGSEDE